MWTAISAVLTALGPTIFYLLNQWMKVNAKEEDMIKSYYSFLDAVDKSGLVKVANHMASKDALQAEIDRLKAEQGKNSPPTKD